MIRINDIVFGGFRMRISPNDRNLWILFPKFETNSSNCYFNITKSIRFSIILDKILGAIRRILFGLDLSTPSYRRALDCGARRHSDDLRPGERHHESQ